VGEGSDVVPVELTRVVVVAVVALVVVVVALVVVDVALVVVVVPLVVVPVVVVVGLEPGPANADCKMGT